jgi:multiple sugar transport system substrate-binding protein
MTRSEFVKAAGTSAVAATFFAPSIVRAQPKTLRIMTWSHFVPAYDAWFDPFVKKWGQSKGVDAGVDHVSFADVVPRANAEVAAQQGHDLFFFLSPPSAFEQQVLDLTDVTQEAIKRYGPMVPLVRKSTYNDFTKKTYGFSDNWVVDPGDYLKRAWTKVGYPNGPVTYADLYTGGVRIKQQFPNMQVPIGIGYSQDIDSNMATRAMLWSFGASEQDAHENVTLDSASAIEAVEYGAKLFRDCMNPAVLSWNAASNNQALNAEQTSYILNSISAYRTAQDNKLPVADDTFFVPALKGPAGIGVACEHVMGVWVVWKFAKSPDLAKEFLLDLVAAYREAVMASKLYNFPSFMGCVADNGVPLAQKPAAGWKWIRAKCANDPFGSRPPDKLNVLGTADTWATNVGHPGPANPAIGEIFDTFLLPDMFAKAATGKLTAKQSVQQTTERVKAIFAKWKKAGLVGGAA